MKALEVSREKDRATDDIRRITSLAAVLQLMCIANQLRLRDQVLTVTRHPRRPVNIAFTGREPFGFAFTEGHQATFHVPSGHRFVIEHLNVSCCAKNDRVDVQLVTRSPHMFRQMTLNCGPGQGLPEQRSALGQPCRSW